MVQAMSWRLSVFDKTLQESNLWLKALRRSSIPEVGMAYDALEGHIAVLRTASAQENAVHLGQLPTLDPRDLL